MSNSNFGSKVREKIADTPFTDYFFPAIALKETFYIWSRLAKKSDLSISQILELCVGDIIDAPKRGAFPVTRQALEAYQPNGQQMFAIARQSLLDLNAQIPDYRRYPTENKFCHGFGIFQFDLQHFKTNPAFFFEYLSVAKQIYARK